jgi:sugar phosphate isomerase/epimerase
MNYLGISGSTILSDAKRFNELFDYDLEHIEIGEFKNHRQLKRFARMLSHSLCTLGVHSPFIRGRSKYDLIEHVRYTPREAYANLEEDAKAAVFLGAKYLLVHFPYFDKENRGNTDAIIEDGLIALKKLQDKYDMEIVCEPKLGAERSACGIQYLQDFPADIWRRYNLKICIDIGDYVMAAGERNALSYIKKWQDFIRVVHMHNVGYPNGGYTWRPMHRTDKAEGYHNLDSIMSYLKTLDDVYFVLEHTPSPKYSRQYITECILYARTLIF